MAAARFEGIARAAMLVLACSACGTPRTDTDSAARAEPPGASARVLPEHLPWTREFVEPALLVATEIRVEGPVGLLAHIATRSDPEVHERVEKTVPAGFLQQVTVKPGLDNAEIKAQLDQLSIVALQRLIVIEQPGPRDVVVTARGEAWWSQLANKAEKRAETLTLIGKIER